MPTDSTCFHVAIIGPSDTNPEVRQAKAAISRLSDALSRQGISLATHHWSQLPPGIGNPQGYIDDNISWGDIDFVIGFMREKSGSPVANASSGTIHEVTVVLEHHIKTGSPELLFYFHSKAIEQSTEIAKFAEDLRKKALTASYTKTAELELMICDHLRSKIDRATKPPSGVQMILGKLPHNRRLTIEWLMGAQFPPIQEPIATIVVFKNGLGEEYLFDSRQEGSLSYCVTGFSNRWALHLSLTTP